MRLISSLLTSFLVAVLAVLVASQPAPAQMLPGLGSAGSSAEGAADAEAGDAAADPVQLLLQILQDEAARARLVDQLEATQSEEQAVAEPEPRQQTPALGRRIAAFSQAAADRVLDWGRQVGATLGRVPTLLSAMTGDEIVVIFDALRSLLLVIAVTVVVFVTLRTVAIPFYRGIGARAAERPFLGRILPFLGAGIADLAIVVVSWATGYVLAQLFFSQANGIELRQILYLNAFMAVELGKALVRLLLSPSTEALRPLRLPDWGAARLYRVIRMVTSILGYGMLLLLPIIAENLGYMAGRNAAAVIWLVIIVYLVGVVIRYRRPVAEWLYVQFHGRKAATGVSPGAEDEVGPAGGGEDRRRRVARAIAGAWHWAAFLWLFWVLLTVLSRRRGAVTEVLLTSGKVAVAVVVGLIVSGVLGRLIQRGITLPHGVTERVPLLEKRLNRYVPRILLVLRLIILAGVVLYSFSVLDIFSAEGWIASDLGLRLTGTAFSIIVILLLAFAAWLALTSWVDYRLNPTYGQATAREQTLLTLLRNAATIAILILTLMFVLSEIGLNIGPLLASAGVVGLAIGFGAQKMVQDIITGIFIQFENAINVGDVVSAGGITGAVERLTVRSVSLRDLSGIYHIIPFSSVDTVSNYTRDFSFYVIDMGVAYRENVPEVKQAMHDAYDELRADPELGGYLLGDLEWFGLDAFGDNSVVLKCRIKTWPGQQWSAGRAYNELVKRIFDERGIEIPFPQRNVWFGQDRSGNAPPLRVAGRMEQGSPRPEQPSGDTPRAVPPTQDAPTGEDAGDAE